MSTDEKMDVREANLVLAEVAFQVFCRLRPDNGTAYRELMQEIVDRNNGEVSEKNVLDALRFSFKDDEDDLKMIEQSAKEAEL
jgi:hypothetical protein